MDLRGIVMPEVVEGLYYSKEDEWVKVDGDEATIGVTDYAQDALSDVVYLELPEIGASFAAGDIFGVVESVKAASDLYAPIGGEVTAVNDGLVDAPEQVNEDPFGSAWMIKMKIKDAGELEALMDAAGYTAYCEERD
jgi:glycine cleavage system H protein